MPDRPYQSCHSALDVRGGARGPAKHPFAAASNDSPSTLDQGAYHLGRAPRDDRTKNSKAEDDGEIQRQMVPRTR